MPPRIGSIPIPLMYRLVGTRDGRTQSARAWLSGPEFQDLDKQTLGFRTSTDGQLGSGFQDLETKRKAKNQRKERLRPLLFPEENPFVCPSVRAGSAIENASRPTRSSKN